MSFCSAKEELGKLTGVYKYFVPTGLKSCSVDSDQIAVPASARFRVAPTLSEETFACMKSRR